MKEVLLNSAQRIIKQVLTWLEQSKSDAIKERVQDVWCNGVIQGFLNNANILGKDSDVTLTDFFHIKIDTGVSYINGERVLIDPATVAYDASAPSHTTDDGLGTLISTPRSTGSFNIDLTAGIGSLNYLWLAYLQTTDDSFFTLHKITNAKQFYKRTDGYEIQVNTTGVNPDVSRFIFLGQVDLTGSSIAISSNISIVNRELYKTRFNRIGIETNNAGLTDRPATYQVGQQQLFLDEHIKAVGQGTINPFNPHGTALADIGVGPNQTVEAHRIIEHTNGIVTSLGGAPTSSALYAQRVTVSPGDDYITVKALQPGEYIVTNGLAFDYTNISIDVNLVFTGYPAGTYNAYFDSITETFDRTVASIAADTTKFWLATTTWDPTIPGDGNLSVVLDRRRFGTTNLLQRWYTVGRPTLPISGTYGFNLDLAKLEYFNGSSWTALP